MGTTNVTFHTATEFRTLIGKADSPIQIVRNPKGEKKVFVAIGTSRFKCQQDIDFGKPMRFLVEENDTEKACLVNVVEQNNVLFVIE